MAAQLEDGPWALKTVASPLVSSHPFLSPPPPVASLSPRRRTRFWRSRHFLLVPAAAMAESSARSSRGSASAGRGGGGGYDGLGSPVAYRVGPLDYTPAKYCYCQLKACRWISWSKKSPGRRYCRCQRSGVSLFLQHWHLLFDAYRSCWMIG